MVDLADIQVGTDRLTAWLVANVSDATAPFQAELVAGGRSNLTYILADANGRRLVLRRPPMGHVLESAHDVVREYRIQRALAESAVPVAPLLALCMDPAVLGACFYVMDFVDGIVMRDENSVNGFFSTEQRGRVSDSLIDCLAELHMISPDSIGLGELGKRMNYAERQIRRWRQQFDAVKSREVPVIDEVARRLAAAVPEQRRTGIVHGDFRLDNCIVASDCSLRAVLDWELCALGDPLADLGLLMVYWPRPGDDAPKLLAGAPTYLDGFRDRNEIIERYVGRTGADVADLDYFRALGYWKLACIFEGIRVRYAAGVMADNETSGEEFGDQAVELAETALKVIGTFVSS